MLASLEGNKAVILVSDGYDNRSTESDYQKSLQSIENSKAIVFPVYLDNFETNLRSLTRGSGITVDLGVSSAIASELNVPAEEQDRIKWQYEIGGLYMNDLVFVSGGRAMFAGDLLVKSTKQKYDIGQQLRTQYYLTLSLPQGAVGTRRQIRVRVNRHSLAVLARGSYLIPFKGKNVLYKEN